MTVCVKCSAKAIKKLMRSFRGNPTHCVECKKPLAGEKETKRWRWDRLEKYFCDACSEKILYASTQSCYWCGTPITPKGYKALRQVQNKEIKTPEYMRRAQGRKVA